MVINVLDTAASGWLSGDLPGRNARMHGRSEGSLGVLLLLLLCRFGDHMMKNAAQSVCEPIDDGVMKWDKKNLRAAISMDDEWMMKIACF